MEPDRLALYSTQTRDALRHLGVMPYWALISQADRDKAESSGAAMPGGGYPILSCEGENSVDSAIGAVGRGSGSHNAIRKHIMTRAKSLGCSSKIPDNWNADGSLKGDSSSSSASSAILASVAPRKLSEGRSRTELIQTWALAVPPPPPAADAPPKAADPAKPTDALPDATEADATVTSDIADIRTALEKAIADQSKDPDSKDPKDAKVSDDLNALMTALKALETDQAADAAGNPPPKPAAAPPPPPADAPPPAATSHLAAPVAPAVVPGPDAEQPKTSPVDDQGNIDPNHLCANPDCGHLASAHGDTPEGQNTGPCSMANCECPAMQIEAAGTDDNAPSVVPADDSGDPANTIGDQTSAEPSAFAGPVGGAVPSPPVAPAPPPPQSDGTPSEATPTLNQPPAMPGGEAMGPAFTIPVAVIEGQATGDGREIAPMALDWRIPPIPLMGLSTSPHDPAGFDMNDPAVWCGRIDSFARVAGQGGTQLIVGKGFYLANDDGMYFADLNEAMGRLGISADIAVETSEVSITDIDDTGFPTEMSDMLTKGTIMGLTVCPFPAFDGAYIVLGDGTDGGPPAIAQAKEADNPDAGAAPAVAASAAPIHFMTYEECEVCAQGFDTLVAAGGPVAPPKAWFENPNFTEDDGRLVEIVSKRKGNKFGGQFACPITITADGQFFGHIAPWGVCHTGRPGCVTAPHSKSDYAHFKRGRVVTAEGESVRTGVITAETGHASQRNGLSAASAMAHYDNTALQAVDVNIGEDVYGIWVAGAVRPDATPEQVRKLLASSYSGDWRDAGGLELVAVLAVNQPGFPLAVVADGHIESMVATGATVMHALAHPPEPEPVGDVALRRALGPLLDQAKGNARDRIAALTS